jgi:hydrogenase-4 component F
MPTAHSSLLPLLLILLPICGALFTVLFGWVKIKNGREINTLVILVVQLYGAIRVSVHVFNGQVLQAAGQAISIDGLSGLMVLLVNLMVMIIALYSVRYMQHEVARGAISDGRLTLYYSLLLLFTGAMNWTITTNHLVMLYVAMEASTLATALLVAFYRSKASLEAGFKYVLLVVVGMTFALFGIVLIFAAAYPFLGSAGLLISRVGSIAAVIPKNIALLAIAFLTVGFATKAGLVPFHAWLPDAHSEAPAPISALLSGLIIKIGAYALTRTVTIFAPTYHAIVVFIAILCSISMVIGIVMALAQDDLKRMLAFSSVSQISYVFEGLGLGTYLGIYGGLFHLINHTLIKALLFLSVGSVMYASGGLRRISQLSGLGKKMPITAFCFITGSLAISGLPPLNGFVSKFTLFLALGQSGLWWALAISLLTGLLTLACMVRAAYLVFWQSGEGVAAEIHGEVPASMYFSMLVLAGLSLAIGLYPNLLYPILDTATKAVLAIWSAE